MSGWADERHEGIAPGIDGVPADDRAAFVATSQYMFGGVTLDMELKSVLLCVLLLHYPAVERVQTSCSVHQKLVNCPFLRSPNKVTEWSAALKTWFDHRNGAYVPLSQVDDDNSINVLSFKEYVNWSTNYLMEMHAITVSTNEKLDSIQRQFNYRLDEVLSLLRKCTGDGIEEAPAAEVPIELMRAVEMPSDLLSLKKLHVEAVYFRCVGSM